MPGLRLSNQWENFLEKSAFFRAGIYIDMSASHCLKHTLIGLTVILFEYLGISRIRVGEARVDTPYARAQGGV